MVQAKPIDKNWLSVILSRSFANSFLARRKSVGKCQVWVGAICQGYGACCVKGKDGRRKMFRANRIALIIFLGRDIFEGMYSLHTCDNRACLAEEHLYEGTPKQNQDDRAIRGKGQSSLTDAVAAEIRVKYATGKYSQRELGIAYSVHQTEISKIVLRQIRK